MNKFKMILLILVSVIVGIIIGGYLFAQSQPRSFLSINRCQNCLSRRDLLGLVASIGILKFPGLIPSVVLETDRTVVVRHPFPLERIHYLIIPKKDIKNIGEISEANAQYLIDAYLVVRRIIEEEKLSKYQLFTNGPGFQDVTYLHFQLIAE
jgi:hypothetical protein